MLLSRTGSLSPYALYSRKQLAGESYVALYNGVPGSNGAFGGVPQIDSQGNSYLVASGSSASNFKIVKVSKSGTIVWQKLYSFAGFSVINASNMVLTNSGDLYCAGTIGSPSTNGFLLKINSVSGDVIWGNYNYEISGDNTEQVRVAFNETANYVYLLVNRNVSNTYDYLMTINPATGAVLYSYRVEQSNTQIAFTNLVANGDKLYISGFYTYNTGSNLVGAALYQYQFNSSGQLTASTGKYVQSDSRSDVVYKSNVDPAITYFYVRTVETNGNMSLIKYHSSTGIVWQTKLPQLTNSSYANVRAVLSVGPNDELVIACSENASTSNRSNIFRFDPTNGVQLWYNTYDNNAYTSSAVTAVNVIDNNYVVRYNGSGTVGPFASFPNNGSILGSGVYTISSQTINYISRTPATAYSNFVLNNIAVSTTTATALTFIALNVTVTSATDTTTIVRI